MRTDRKFTEEIAWGEFRWEGAIQKNTQLLSRFFQGQIPSEKLRAHGPRLMKWFPNAGRWDMHGKKFVDVADAACCGELRLLMPSVFTISQ